VGAGCRFGCVACLTIGLALASAPVASAKVWFQNAAGRTVPPGRIVQVSVRGCEANPACGIIRGIRIFVIPQRSSSWSEGGSPSPRWFVGKVGSQGKLSFRVPSVPAGSYRLVAYLTWGTQPEFLVASGTFRVTSSGYPVLAA
jgi:hypothetical protein